LKDVIREIESHRSKAHMDEYFYSMAELMNLTDLISALKVNRPKMDSSKLNIMYEIEHVNAIVFEELSTIHYRLGKLPPSECGKYVVIELSEMSTYSMSIMLRHARRDILESLNVIIAERLTFISGLVEHIQMSDECHKLIYPPTTPEPRFVRLSLSALSGAFAMTICSFGIAIVILLIEIVCKRHVKHVRRYNIAERLDAVMFDRFICDDNYDEELLTQYYKFRTLLTLRHHGSTS
jgi:hypothetical protein